MQKRFNKKAQFYIIAAVIIILVLVAMAGVTNYISIKEEPKVVYDLGENLELEGSWVVDYGIYNNQEIDDNISYLAIKFSEYLAATGEDFELIVAYGTQQGGKIRKYIKNSTGIIEVGGTGFQNYVIEEQELGNIRDTTEIQVRNNTYSLEAGENENFLFVLTTSRGFEEYVYGNIENED